MWVISPTNLALIPSDIQPTGGPGAVPGYPKLVTQYHFENSSGANMTQDVNSATSVNYHFSPNAIQFSSSNPFGVKYEDADYTFTDRADVNNTTIRVAELPAGHLFHASANMRWWYDDGGVGNEEVTNSFLAFSIIHSWNFVDVEEEEDELIEIVEMSADQSPLTPYADYPFGSLSVTKTSVSGMFYTPESDLVTYAHLKNEIQIYSNNTLAATNIKVLGFNYTLLDLGPVGIISGVGFG